MLGHHRAPPAVLPGGHLLAQCDSLIHRLQLDSAKLNSWPSLTASGDGLRASNGVQGALLHCACSMSRAGLFKLLNDQARVKQQVATNKGKAASLQAWHCRCPHTSCSWLIRLWGRLGSAIGSGRHGSRYVLHTAHQQSAPVTAQMAGAQLSHVAGMCCTLNAGTTTSHSTAGQGTAVAWLQG